MKNQHPIMTLFQKINPWNTKKDKRRVWKSDTSRIGSKNRGENTWLGFFRSVKKSLDNRSRSKGYLSRVELRKKLMHKTVKFCAMVLVILCAVVLLKKPVLLYLTGMEFFQIQKIHVSGYGVTDPANLKNIAGVNYRASIFSFSPSEASDRLLASPWVRSAEVKRLWPDGVSIHVKEYAASAIMVVEQNGKQRLYYMNTKGEVFAPVPSGGDVDYPIITGRDLLPEKYRNEALVEASEFIRLINRNDPNLPAQSVSQIHLDADEGLIIHLVDYTFPIYFGRGEVRKKYKQLRNVLAVLYKKRKQNIDIGQIDYIRMDYLNNKVLVAQENSG